ncbi:MAG: Zn-ribbon domain-containing OB-fold protein [Bacillota bacterium]
MKNRANIYTYTIIYTATEDFKDKTPYVVAVVEDNNQRFFTFVEGYDQNIEVTIGMEVEFVRLDESSRPVYKFIKTSE